MAKFLEIMVNQRFQKLFLSYHMFPCIRDIFKRQLLMASSLHVNAGVDAYVMSGWSSYTWRHSTDNSNTQILIKM